MTGAKQWVALTAVGCLAVLAAAWFLLISPTRAQAADLRTQALAQEQSNAGLRAQLAQLQAQAEQLPASQRVLEAVAAKVPADAGLPVLVRALDDLSARTGVELVTLSPGALTPGGGAPDPAATAPAAPAGWSTLPLTMEVVGSFYDVQAYVAGLEGLTRAVRVTGLTLAPGANPVDPGADATSADDGRSLRVTITAEAYATAPVAAPAPAPAATPPAPAAAAAPGGSS